MHLWEALKNINNTAIDSHELNKGGRIRKVNFKSYDVRVCIQKNSCLLRHQNKERKRKKKYSSESKKKKKLLPNCEECLASRFLAAAASLR